MHLNICNVSQRQKQVKKKQIKAKARRYYSTKVNHHITWRSRKKTMKNFILFLPGLDDQKMVKLIHFSMEPGGSSESVV